MDSAAPNPSKQPDVDEREGRKRYGDLQVSKTGPLQGRMKRRVGKAMKIAPQKLGVGGQRWPTRHGDNQIIQLMWYLLGRSSAAGSAMPPKRRALGGKLLQSAAPAAACDANKAPMRSWVAAEPGLLTSLTRDCRPALVAS